MPVGKFSRLRLSQWDGIYLLFSSVAGVWQAWCANSGSNQFMVLQVILMGVPFALASYAHASLSNRVDSIAERLDWKRALVLWAGMPLCLVVVSLTMFVQAGITHLIGFATDNVRLIYLWIVIGEGAACFFWAECLLIWSRQQAFSTLRRPLLALFAALFPGALCTLGLSELILIGFHKDITILLTSIVMTTISALILVLLQKTTPGTSSKDRSAV